MSRYSFTPHIIRQQQKLRLYQLTALTLIVTTLSLAIFHYLPTATATETTSWSTTSDFATGSTTNTVITSADTVTLYAEEFEDDFGEGRTNLNTLSPTTITSENQLRIGRSIYTYGESSNPSLVDGDVQYTSLNYDKLYIATSDGFSVIDTKGTVTPNDDTSVGAYDASSTPALIPDSISHIEPWGDYIYAGGSYALHVIDTQGTEDQADDVVVTDYSHVVTNMDSLFVYHFFFEGDLLYLSTWSGVFVADTKGTPDPMDDTLSHSYRTNTSPAILSNGIYHSFLDTETNLLYMSTFEGVAVVDTNGTATSSDDVKFIDYTDESTPSLPPIFDSLDRLLTYHSQIVADVLYISSLGGLTAIDTKGTKTLVDDEKIGTYSTTSVPALNIGLVRSSFVIGDILYIDQISELVVIDTQGTKSLADDEIVKVYNSNSDPALPGGVRHPFIVDNKLYINGNSGLSVIDLNGGYLEQGQYQSDRRYAATIPTTSIVVSASVAADQEVSLQYRTGSTTNYWRDDFSTTTNRYAGDWLHLSPDFGLPAELVGFQATATTPEGTLEFSELALFEVFPGEGLASPLLVLPANTSTGSEMVLRVRVSSDEVQYDGEDGLALVPLFFNHDVSENTGLNFDTDFVNVDVNEWHILSIGERAWEAAPDGLFQPVYSAIIAVFDEDSWSSDDSLEIDWIEVIAPPTWGEWSDPCTLDTCPIDQALLENNDLIQYRLTLETDDPNTTPTVNSVTYRGDYASTGTYTSDLHDFARLVQPLTFNADVTTPASTTVSFEYSIDQGVSWQSITPGDLFPDDLQTDAIKWRANLSTTNPLVTPVINSVSIDWVALSTESTRLSILSPDQSIIDSDKDLADPKDHKGGGNSRPSREYVQTEIVRILRETVTILERIREIEEKGE